ncbi:MAG TPA: NYN domain-containing protein [Verrucomicrobiota bacterium]|nr:NYN domain-containing protein [Verrucomicrobiota bacterium]
MRYHPLLKTVIYVDGQNLHYELENHGLLEKDVDWGKLFGYLTPERHRLVRGYWYQAARIAPWEWNPRHHPKLCPAGMELAAFQAAAEDYYRSETQRLEGLHKAVFGRIEENFDAIEFRYVGVLQVDPTRFWTDDSGKQRVGKRVGEKGVDVALAVDMVRHAAGYDHAVLLSGDFDYVPAIQAVKDMLRRVTVVTLSGGAPTQGGRQARRLRSLCDNEVDVAVSDLKGRFRFNPAQPPAGPSTP